MKILLVSIFIIFFAVITIIILSFKKSKQITFIKGLANLFSLSISNNKKIIEGEYENNYIKGAITKEYYSNFSTKTFKVVIKPIIKSSFRLNIEKKRAAVIKNNITTVDNEFDKSYYINTNQKRRIIAVLDKETRDLILGYINQYIRFSIINNEIVLSYQYFTLRYWEKIIKNLINLSNKLYRSIDIDINLINNIEKEKNNAVRIKNMENLLLSDELNKYKSLFLKLKNDPVNEIAIIANYALKEEGIDYLLTIIKDSNDNLKIMAIDYLKKFWNNKDVLREFYKLLNSYNEYILIKIINIFIKINDKESIIHVNNFIKNNHEYIIKSISLLNVISDYIQIFKVKDCDLFLKNLLESNDKNIKLKAINTIAKLGDISLIQYIYPLSKGLNHPDIKNAVNNAISILQKNIPLNQRGDLTLAEIENSGKLSLKKDNDNGKLSIDNNIQDN